MSRRPTYGAWWLLAAVLLPHRGQAATLQDALEMAYRTSPALHGQQAGQRATEENAVQARAGWKPTLAVTAGAGYEREPFDTLDYGAGSAEVNDTEAALTVTQPLYTGGRVAHAVAAADARSRAGRAGLLLTEAQLFQAVIGAYMDVLQDAQVLEVRRADLGTLRRQLADTAARFRLGADVTRTDVAQAETQMQAADAARSAAEAALAASQANYTAVIGAPPPAVMTLPDSLPGVPSSLHAALDAAEAANPALQQTVLTAQASDADIGTARAQENPSIGLQGSVGVIGSAAPFHAGAYDRTATALVTLTVPLYNGGLLASQVRQAQDRHEADRQTAEATGRQARQDVLTAWSATQAGLAATRANIAQVNAGKTALAGYQAEYGYGLRSTLDVLIADENLRAAEVALAESRHDTIVAEATLLAATGRLSATQLLHLPE